MVHKYSRIAAYLAVAMCATGGYSYANTDVDSSFFTNAITAIGTLVNLIIPVLIALGVLFFIWGLVQFIFASGDEAAKDEGKRKMIWGVIALFVIVSVWGLVALLNQVTGVNQTTQMQAVKIVGA
jgi:hypothetical protein